MQSLKNNIGGPYGTGPDIGCNNDPNSAGCKNNPRITGLLGFLHNWALTTNGGDALSHYFRVFFVADTSNATGGLGVLPPIPGVNNTLLKGQPGASGSATGLTPTQEQSALGTLMGGR